MNSLSSTQIQILAEGQNIHLSGNSKQTNTFSLNRSLKDGEKIKFKVRYSADLESFGLLEVFLMNTRTGTGIVGISIHSGSVQSEEREREFNLQDTGDYHFLFKMSAGIGTFDIENYQLYWSAN